MGRLIEEVKEWNTPVVGAYLLWRFTKGYIDHHPSGDAPIAILHFIISGILTNQEICDAINGHKPDLASFSRWFNEKKRSDLLACLQQHIALKRSYTLRSIEIAVATGLLTWDIETAKLYYTDIKKVKKGTALMGIAVQQLGGKAEILGKWFSQHDLHSIIAY
jgi:hypothetical protein